MANTPSPLAYYYQLPALLSAPASTGSVTGTTTSTATVTGSRTDTAAVAGATVSGATVTASATGGAGTVTGTTTSHATITAIVVNPVVVSQGSWYELISITDEARQYALQARELALIACPNDGEPYRTGPDGSLFCPYDGYKPKP